MIKRQDIVDRIQEGQRIINKSNEDFCDKFLQEQYDGVHQLRLDLLDGTTAEMASALADRYEKEGGFFCKVICGDARDPGYKLEFSEPKPPTP